MTELPTFVRVSTAATARYWDDYAVRVRIETDDLGEWFLLATIRGGTQGRSDAHYIADRLASGMHAAQVIEITAVTSDAR